jgi:hypothetical protein
MEMEGSSTDAVELLPFGSSLARKGLCRLRVMVDGRIKRSVEFPIL